MADTEKPTPEQIAALAAAHFGEPVVKITAPGGKSRESVRVHFDDISVIATYRKRPARRALEAGVLDALSKAGAPVPRYLGAAGDIFFQQDLGSVRLTSSLASHSGGDLVELAAASIDSLFSIHEAADTCGLTAKVPALGAEASWCRNLAASPRYHSTKAEIDPVELDEDAIADVLTVAHDTFIKWDARPGNGGVADDGKVVWFDWEHCGRRNGLEDIAWLSADEFWPIQPEGTIRLVREVSRKPFTDQDDAFLSVFAALHATQRLGLILRQVRKHGWGDAERAMRYDKIGSSEGLLDRTVNHGAQWADRHSLTRPLVDWFERYREATKAGVYKTS
jgi:hypothetical protein